MSPAERLARELSARGELSAAAKAKDRPPCRLAEVREKTGLSQTQAAAGLKLMQCVLSSYELGKTLPGVHVALRIARFFGVTVEHLWPLPDDPKPTTTTEE